MRTRVVGVVPQQHWDLQDVVRYDGHSCHSEGASVPPHPRKRHRDDNGSLFIYNTAHHLTRLKRYYCGRPLIVNQVVCAHRTSPQRRSSPQRQRKCRKEQEEKLLGGDHHNFLRSSNQCFRVSMPKTTPARRKYS